MKRQQIITQATARIRRLLSLCLLVVLSSTVAAKDFFGFTEDHPLVIVSDWDFRPYEFINSKGKPSGYNIEALDLILNRLEIPHRFVLQEWYLCVEMFERREADLIHALNYQYKEHPYVRTKNYINYYTLRVARRMDTPPLRSIKNLDESDTLLLKRNDYADLRIEEEIQEPVFTKGYLSPKDALTEIRRGHFKYLIWGEIPLSRKIKELTLDSILLDEIDIPAGELRIIGYDKDLLDAIDDEYARLDQSGEMEIIRDKWFHPEKIHDEASPIALLLLAGIAVVGIIAFLLSRLITLRVKAAVAKSEEVNNMMMQALSMGEYLVVEYDIAKDLITNRHGSLISGGKMTLDDFVSRLATEEKDDFRQHVANLTSGTETQWAIRIRWNTASSGFPVWRYLNGYAITEFENGEPRYIVSTLKDVTEEVEQERTNTELSNKYRTIFEKSLVAMSYYDKDGWLIDLNDKMRDLCNFDEEKEAFYRRANMFDNVFFKGEYDKSSQDIFHCCFHFHLPEVGINKYIESHIRPVINDKGETVYYIVTSRDITADHDMYQKLHMHDRKLLEANDIAAEYEHRLYYLLEECSMFIWHYNPQAQIIRYAQSLQGESYEETLTDFFAGVNEDEREGAIQKVLECTSQQKPYSAVHRYNYTPLDNKTSWYAISGMPTYDKNGNFVEYFGMARNMTTLMEAQQKLKEETARAEDSGRLKAAFLANMTHEIRTPLNAIVGFSDILQMVDTQEERMEFIRIIRNNCDMLLRLINDILEASSMGQALAIEPEDIDLSKVFDDICQTLEQRVQKVAFIKDNPYDTFPAHLDKGRIQQVLTNFVTNAVKYTHEGHIKVGYREEDGGVYFYCEDTGAGIPKEKQAAVFERFIKLNDFVQGTGLGLSICKSISERCGGRIGVSSEGEGHGSTFWLWIPREISQQH